MDHSPPAFLSLPHNRQIPLQNPHEMSRRSRRPRTPLPQPNSNYPSIHVDFMCKNTWDLSAIKLDSLQDPSKHVVIVKFPHIVLRWYARQEKVRFQPKNTYEFRSSIESNSS